MGSIRALRLLKPSQAAKFQSHWLSPVAGQKLSAKRYDPPLRTKKNPAPKGAGFPFQKPGPEPGIASLTGRS